MVVMIIRPYCMRAVHRCSLLLQMSRVAWSVCLSVCLSVCHMVCLSVCWSHRCAVQKQVNQLRCHLEADSCESKEPCIRWGQDRMNPFAAVRGDKTAMRPFARLLRTLVIIIIIIFCPPAQSSSREN